MANIKNEDRRDFYVYHLIRTYKETKEEEVCYVGRGCGSRVNSHIPELRKGKHKNKLLQSWYNTKNSEFRSITIYKDLTNEEANNLEIDQIKIYGRFDTGEGTLANLTDGGDGTIGFKHSEETIKNLSKIVRGLIILITV